MPKVKRERSKQHAPPAATVTSKDGWQPAGSKARKAAAASDIPEVEDSDLIGLDLEGGAKESEASKRAAIAAALKDLITMEDDDEDDDDDDDDDMGDLLDDDEEDADEDGDASMGGSNMKLPMKGTLFTKSAMKKASSTTPSTNNATVTSTQVTKSGLSFAPSTASRSAPQSVAAPVAAAAAASDATGGVAKKATKIDKRAARHAKLMGRLGLPGTEFGTRGQKKHPAAGPFGNMRLDFQDALLTPSEQNARTLAARREAQLQAEQKRDVLFLSDGVEQERMVKLQKSIADAKAKRQAIAAAAATTASSSSSQQQQPSANEPVAPAAVSVKSTPSPFVQTKPLTASQRAQLKRRELAQFTAVLHHPSFQASPLAALQLHTENSAAMKRLEAEHSSMYDEYGNNITTQQQQQPKKQLNGSKKKKNKNAAAHRQQILAQANQK